MISKNALEEYKEIHRQETGEVFSDDVLLDEAINLLTLFDRVYRPIKKEWLKEYGKQSRMATKSIPTKENKTTACREDDGTAESQHISPQA